MRLRALQVTDFGAVESAEVTFEDGLNVLHGPNDLGKSTLAAAIRSALLLQHASSGARPFVPWGTARKPQVTLTFEADGRWWRVHKTFGTTSGGKSVLEWSNDGVMFSLEEEGRGVDGKLRELLGWGLAKPGGKGGSHGFPKSFLSTVLLGEQALPYRLLEQSLEGDVEDSGKARLIEALQAMGTDPVYQHVLEEAQAQVDQAFTAKGKRSTRKGSPFERVAEDIKQRRASSDELAAAVAESDAVVSRLGELASRRDAAMAAKAAAASTMDRLQEALAQRQARAALQAEVDEANEVLAEIQRNGEEIGRLQTQLREAEAALPDATAAAEAAAEAVRRAQAERDRALAEHEARASGDDPQLRSERAAWDEAMRGVAAQEAALISTRANLEAWLRAAGAQQETQQRQAQARAAVDAAEASASSEQARVDAAEARVRVLLDAARWARAESLRSRLEAAHARQAQARAIRAEAASKRAEADALRGALAVDFPGAAKLEAMEAAWRTLSLETAALRGGVRVTVEIGDDVQASVAVDGGPKRTSAGRAQVDAERELVLEMASVGTVTVRPGSPDAHAAVERATASWAPHAAALERLGVATMDALAEAAKERAKTQRACEERIAEATVLEAKAPPEDPDVLSSLQRELEVAQRGLEEVDAAACRAAHQEHGDDLDAAAREAEAELERLRRLSAEAKMRHADARTQAQLADERVEAATLRLAELAPAQNPEQNPEQDPEQDPRAAALALEQTQADLEARRAELERQATRRGDAAAERIEAAREAAAQAESVLRAQTQREVQARAQLQAARERKASADAALEVRRERAAHHDPLRAAERVAKAQDALAAQAAPAIDVTEAALEHARTALGEAQDALEDAERAVRQQEGALQHVGGQVVRERAQMAREALDDAKRQEAEVTLDYDGWRLLLGTLRDVENETGAHLGRALGTEVADRMVSLSGGRYQGASLGADLETQGVLTSRGVQALDRFSEGVKEQVATLLRVSVAEHLGTMLLLDDHLAQTDPQRAAWFRELLHHSADRVQIVVLTCRPADYLADADARAHVIALADAVQRQA